MATSDLTEKSGELIAAIRALDEQAIFEVLRDLSDAQRQDVVDDARRHNDADRTTTISLADPSGPSIDVSLFDARDLILTLLRR